MQEATNSKLDFEWLRDEADGWTMWWVYRIKYAGVEFDVRFQNPRREFDEGAVWAEFDKMEYLGMTEEEAEEKGEPYHPDFWLDEVREQMYVDLTP